MSNIGLIGKKIGMSREFFPIGISVPVTVIKIEKANALNSYDEKYHVYDHEFGGYIHDDKKRKKRGIFYALIIGIVFIASHYMAIQYVEDEGSAGFYPPYIEKRVVYPELYKDKAYGWKFKE